MTKRHHGECQHAHGERNQGQRQAQITRQQMSGYGGTDKVGNPKAQQDQRDALHACLPHRFKERTQIGEEGKMTAEDQNGRQHSTDHSRTTQNTEQCAQAAAALRLH